MDIIVEMNLILFLRMSVSKLLTIIHLLDLGGAVVIVVYF